MLEVGTRVKHTSEPSMYGSVLAWTNWGKAVYLVKWDGGVSQWMEADQVRTIR